MYCAFFIILYCGQQMHNYFTNYHNPTCDKIWYIFNCNWADTRWQ